MFKKKQGGDREKHTHLTRFVNVSRKRQMSDRHNQSTILWSSLLTRKLEGQTAFDSDNWTERVKNGIWVESSSAADKTQAVRGLRI